MGRQHLPSATVGAVAVVAAASLLAQNIFRASRDHAAIQYSTRAPQDPAARLNQRLDKGEVKLAAEGPRGYLRALLTALDISPSSQALVFSENSLQREHISKATPRAIYFNDSVAVGWANGTESIEVAAQDPAQGVIFYSLAQKGAQPPRLERRAECLQCHLTMETSGVPGLFMMSVLPLSDNKNEYARGWAMDHRTPIDDRWGGWYVTGTQVPARHLGNVPVSHVPRSYERAEVAPRLSTGAGTFDVTPYLTPYSDVVALLVLNHQLHMMNLLTRLNWESRIAESESARPNAAVQPADVRETVREVVDYLLFVDEAPLASPIRGSSTFADEFARRGPRDARGRSLRDFDLTGKLFRHACSYMIYSEAFNTLPARTRAMVYERMWEILTGKDPDKVYARLSLSDRRDIVDILRETKKDIPQYFQPIAK